MHRSLLILIAILSALPLGVRCEGDATGAFDGSLTIFNDTSYYLHVTIGGSDFPWTPPGDATPRVGVNIGETLHCSAAYSPGQGEEGGVEFDYTPAVTGSTPGTALSCSDGLGTTCDPLITNGTAPHHEITVTRETLEGDG